MLKTKIGNLKWVEINMAELDLDKLISHFAQSNKAEGKSPKTVSWYTEMLSDFVRFLKSVGATGILSEFNLDNVRDFIIHEQNRQVSPYTVHGKARALKAFISWLYAEGYTASNLLAGLKLPKAPIKRIEPLTAMVQLHKILRKSPRAMGRNLKETVSIQTCYPNETTKPV